MMDYPKQPSLVGKPRHLHHRALCGIQTAFRVQRCSVQPILIRDKDTLKAISGRNRSMAANIQLPAAAFELHPEDVVPVNHGLECCEQIALAYPGRNLQHDRLTEAADGGLAL